MAKSKSQDSSNTILFTNLWRRDFQSVRLSLHSLLMRADQTSTSTASIAFQIDQVRRAVGVLQEKPPPSARRNPEDEIPEELNQNLDQLLELLK